MAEHIRVLLSEEEVDRRIQEIGDQISRDYAGKQIHLVCVLKGGSFFMCELERESRFPYHLTLCPYPATEAIRNPAVLSRL